MPRCAEDLEVTLEYQREISFRNLAAFIERVNLLRIFENRTAQLIVSYGNTYKHLGSGNGLEQKANQYTLFVRISKLDQQDTSRLIEQATYRFEKYLIYEVRASFNFLIPLDFCVLPELAKFIALLC